MTIVHWGRWIRQYVLPLGFLIISVILALLIGNAVGHPDIDFIWIIAVAPIIGFLIGYAIRPERVVVLPAATVVLWEMVIVLGRGPSDAMATLLPVTALIGFPLGLLIWIGKKARARHEDRRDNIRQTPVA